MSQKIKRAEPDIGVRATHYTYGEVELVDKISSITDQYWIVSDENGELRIANERDFTEYYNY